ncbi:MAG TPA: PAS domain-containing protein [Flavitalea sp.]|nr:PAS domain-containing protein [Flavitalea sp.]
MLDVRLVTAPVSLFFCALMFSAWYGGIKPGLLSVALSLLAFKFFFINPVYSLASDLREIPRLLIFALSALFVVLLSEAQKDIAESLRHARNILEGTVQKLMQTNTALQKEIAERKQAEDALRKSDDQIRLIIDTIPTMVWSTRPDGNIDFLNQRWLDYSGLSFEQCIKNPMAPVHPEDIPKVMENSLLNRTAGKAYEDEMRLRRADGEYRWFLMRTAPLHDNQGNPIKWYGVSIDIEDSKRTEEQIKQSEAHLAEAQQLAKMGSWDFDIKADRLTWSEELYNIFDTDKQTFDETHGSFLHLIDEGDREFALQTSRYTQQTGEPFIIEYHITTTKGEKRIIHERGYRQTDDTGKVVRLFGTAQDITERKQAEEALQQSYQEIRRLTEHLQKIREEERITIAREIHDELGQQLTVLKMEVKGLNKKLNDADEGIKQKIRDILDLLDTTVKSVRRISSELRPSLLYNLGLVAAMEWHLKEFEKRSGIKTIFNEPKEELELPDSLKNGLFRIFQESLTNVSRHAYANKIMVTLEQKGQQLILSIEDNGRGFKKEKIAAKDTLGILGMKERSQMMGGYYEIISIPAEGTTVIVAVPYTGKNNLI